MLGGGLMQRPPVPAKKDFSNGIDQSQKVERARR
jgi:hypothetical protein